MTTALSALTVGRDRDSRRDACQCARAFLSGGPSGPRAMPPRLRQKQVMFDRFELSHPIDGSGCSTVWLAFDREAGCERALKIRELPVHGGTSIHAELVREAYLTRVAACPQHVIGVFDLLVGPGEDGGELAAICLEYADGGSFRDWEFQFRKDHEHKCRAGMYWVWQMCLAVGAAHDRGVIHLDVKPENFLFVGGGLKLADFGMAILKGLPGNQWDGLASPTSWRGTAPYMSPEQFTVSSPADLDARSDIYSLGIILYELLNPCCRPPYGGDWESVRDQHLCGSLPPTPWLSTPLRSVVQRCLHRDPDQRYQTLERLLADLLPLPMCSPDETDAGCERCGRLWQGIEESTACEAYQDADEKCADLMRLKPKHAEAARLREEIRERYTAASNIYKEVETTIGSADLRDLVAATQRAADMFPTHPDGERIQVLLASRVRAFRDYLTKAASTLEWNLHGSASCLRAAQAINPGCEPLADLARVYTAKAGELMLAPDSSSGHTAGGERPETSRRGTEEG